MFNYSLTYYLVGTSSLRFFINRHSLRDFPDNLRDIPILFSICCDLLQFEVRFILSGVTIHTPRVRLRPFTHKSDILLLYCKDRIHHFRVFWAFAFPLIVVFHIQGFALDVATMNGVLVYIRLFRSMDGGFEKFLEYPVFHENILDLFGRECFWSGGVGDGGGGHATLLHMCINGRSALVYFLAIRTHRHFLESVIFGSIIIVNICKYKRLTFDGILVLL